MILQTLFEIILVTLLICGLIFESHIAEWEQKVFASIKKKFRNRKAATKRKSFTVIEGKQ